MNDALPQAIEELRAVDGLFTIGFRMRIAIVDKHQIEIRAMPQLDTADLTVADNDEIRIADAAVSAAWRAVFAHCMAPGQGQHLIENRLSQPGQVVADLHQRQGAGNFRGSHAQTVRQLEVTQRLHLLLQILLGNAHQSLAQLGGQLGGQRRIEQAPFIKQLIKQQREAGDLLGNPRAGGAQGQQALQRAGVFREQH